MIDQGGFSHINGPEDKVVLRLSILLLIGLRRFLQRNSDIVLHRSWLRTSSVAIMDGLAGAVALGLSATEGLLAGVPLSATGAAASVDGSSERLVANPDASGVTYSLS